MTLRYCPSCGADGLTRPELKKVHCPACGFTLYLNAAAAAAAILTDGDRILLTVRARDPGKGMLDLPGGFTDPGEGIEDGLRRELREELGVEVGHLTYLGSWPNTYPYGGVTYTTCDVVFTGMVDPTGLQAFDDVAALEWHPLATVPIERVAFPSLRSALRRYLGNMDPPSPAT